MSQVFGDSKRLVNDYMAASHAIGITKLDSPGSWLKYSSIC